MMRKIRHGSKPKAPPLEDNAASNLTVTVQPTKKAQGYYGSSILPSKSQWILIVYIAIIACIVYGIYKFKNVMNAYLRAKKIRADVRLLYPNQPKVGETIACKIRFRGQNGRFVPAATSTFNELVENAVIMLATRDGQLQEDIVIIKEASEDHNYILGKFSLRQAGEYEISVRQTYTFLKMASDPPFLFHAQPGPPSYKKINFGTHNPNVLCAVAGVQEAYRISCCDEYGNKSRAEDVDLSKFSFKLFHLGVEMIPDNCEFCLYEESFSNAGGSTLTVGMRLLLMHPGIYICALNYGDFEIQHKQNVPKLVVCISSEEAIELEEMVSKTIPGTCLYTTPCKLLLQENIEETSMPFFAGITYRKINFGTYKMLLLIYSDYSFPVNGKTNVIYAGCEYRNDGLEGITFFIEDGLRTSIWVEMEPETARKLLLMFAHAQGHSLPSSTISFQEKKAKLKDQLTPFLIIVPWFNKPHELIVQPGNLIRSSMAAAPTNSSDWKSPFNIQFDSGVAAGAIPPVEDWLNLLCQQFFGDEDKFFSTFLGSKLLHPTSSTVSRQPIEYYNFCGKIIGKCILETLVRGSCTRLTGILFTKSFLAYMLGFPIQYKFLETDEPSFFQDIKPIIESNILTAETDYYFTTLPTNSNANENLIPNGSEVRVTNENKEHYLNLLARHRLIHSVEQEICSIREGFYEVIDKDYLCNFEENDLQMLISGGREFDIDDLKAFHRVVREDNSVYYNINAMRRRSAIDSAKILGWFFAATQNMSEREKSWLVYMSTGSFSLPSCGFKDLNPLFTISLTGLFNQIPRGNPASNEIILGDHSSFESFESSLLFAIKPEAERIILPETTTENRLSLYNPNRNPTMLQIQNAPESVDGFLSLEYYNENNQNQDDADMGGGGDQDIQPFTYDPILNWLREHIHL